MLAVDLNVNRYGSFQLTDAIRPGRTPVIPREGYRLEGFRDPISRMRIPLLAAAVSAEKLFDLFLELTEPLGEEVHVVLESSHDSKDDSHEDFRRSHIDRPVLLSYLCDFEDMLLNDGCTGIAVIATERMMEVQLDEHKQIYIYGRRLKSFRRILRKYGIERQGKLALISEMEHLHRSSPEYADQFRDLSNRIGAGDFDSVLSDDGGLYFA